MNPYERIKPATKQVKVFNDENILNEWLAKNYEITVYDIKYRVTYNQYGTVIEERFMVFYRQPMEV